MNIGDKADHVRAEIAKAAPTSHHCHWPGCEVRVAPASWGCKKHWFKLPLHLRRLIWATYKPGQEVSKTPSREYVDAARKVQDWIAENHPPVVKLL